MSQISQLLHARYGEQGPIPHVLSNPIIEALLAHRTVRDFLPDALPEQTLATLIATAQSAASSSNLQTWSVIAIEDPQQKARFADISGGQPHIRQAPLLLIWLADLNRAEQIANQQGSSSEAIHYFDTFLTSVVDATLAAQNVVVAAESLGLGTVYIGALRNDIPQVSQALALPPRVFPVFGLVIGRPDPAKPAAIKPRLPQDTVLFKETYQQAPQAAGIHHYNQVLRQFQQSQQLPEVDWSAQSAERLGKPSAIKGRVHLKRQLKEQLGFALD